MEGTESIVTVISGCSDTVLIAVALPRMEGTERLLILTSVDGRDQIAVACPEWRGLKVWYVKCCICHVSAYCSGLPRMEGTESVLMAASLIMR